MPGSAVSDLGLHCLPITLLGVSRLQWVMVRSSHSILWLLTGFHSQFWWLWVFKSICKMVFLLEKLVLAGFASPFFFSFFVCVCVCGFFFFFFCYVHCDIYHCLVFWVGMGGGAGKGFLLLLLLRPRLADVSSCCNLWALVIHIFSGCALSAWFGYVQEMNGSVCNIYMYVVGTH